METNKISFVNADNNTIINEKHIRWVKKMANCLEVCSKSVGCNISIGDTHKICKMNNPDSYAKLNAYFE